MRSARVNKIIDIVNLDVYIVARYLTFQNNKSRLAH